ncbi:MAG: hypothetical protein ABFC84_09365 [Veillonellales bacterium]
MEKSNDQAKKFDRKTHVISQLAGKDTPSDIKKAIYPEPTEKNRR